MKISSETQFQTQAKKNFIKLRPKLPQYTEKKGASKVLPNLKKPQNEKLKETHMGINVQEITE